MWDSSGAEGRPVFTNIKGINEDGFEPIEGVEPIPMNKNGELDWQLCPEGDAELNIPGSLVIYDEAQKQKDNNNYRYFAWKGREKLSERDVISELDEHRHRGYDIVFLTQEPNLLHLHLLGFVKEHYHCSRPMNKQASQVALWRSWQSKPNSDAATARAEDVFEVPFEQRIFKHYKSTEIVTDKKLRVPKYVKKLALIAAGCIIGIILLFTLFDNPMFNFTAMKAVSGDKEGIDEISKYMPKNMQDAKNTLEQSTDAMKTPVGKDAQLIAENKKLDEACSKQYGLTVAQCADLRDPSKRNNQLAETNPVPAITYDPSKPYELESLQQSINYNVTAKPVFSGCAKYNGRYVAYTQQGTILHDVSQSDCRKLIENGDRPFNYFVSEKSNESAKPGIENLLGNKQL